MAGRATPASAAGHATRSAPTYPELTSRPDHSSGADQAILSHLALQRPGRSFRPLAGTPRPFGDTPRRGPEPSTGWVGGELVLHRTEPFLTPRRSQSRSSRTWDGREFQGARVIIEYLDLPVVPDLHPLTAARPCEFSRRLWRLRGHKGD